MKPAQHWIDRLDEVSSERDHRNWIKAIQDDARKQPLERIQRLKKKVEHLNGIINRHIYDL